MGLSRMCHMFAKKMEEYPSLENFRAVGDNIFNPANRILGLKQVKDHFPAALAYAKDIYFKSVFVCRLISRTLFMQE